MDVETIQLLNLSPIPELSELELSTMMDQLSGLSDINGDLTDQHVEDIIKEAEDLIDKSEGNDTNKFSIKKLSETTENKSLADKQDTIEMKGSGDCCFQEIPLDDSKHYNTPVNSDHLINDECDEESGKKHFSSPIEQTPIKIFSPGGSCNHIKSTIDSLKEFSSMIEMQLTSRSPNLSPKFNKVLKNNERGMHTQEESVISSHLNEKSSHSRIVKAPDLITKKNLLEQPDKSVKLLSCFERLYQNRPIRLSANKKPKVLDKVPKTLTRKKLTKDLKSTLKNSKQGKNIKKFMGEDVISTVTEKIYQNMGFTLPRTVEMDLNLDKTPSEYSSFSNFKYLPDSKVAECKTKNDLLVENLRNDSLGSDKQNSDSSQNLSKIDEKLILKVLEEVKQIKDQVKKAGVFGDANLERATTEEQGVIDSLKSEMESVREKVTSVSNAGIKRLQEQFSLLKLKYYQQMDKLEAENFKLREALHNQQKFFASRKSANNILSVAPEIGYTTETKNYKTSLPGSSSSSDTDKEITQNASENHKVPSTENLPAKTVSKEASCQTETEINNVSIQCTADIPADGKKETASETKKTDNKENITVKCKLGRSKPFSDVGIHQLMRQKKLLNHESQLLATLRGLQTELTVKDRENRKMKTEMESLKKQIKKLVNNKADNCRKTHIGTQTIGLGPSVQKPYTSEIYEVPREFEKENEDLKSRIKALEEEFEFLRAKRINDLQSLHQVHEEEMAKLVSKLETQSSLTRHLHSLLVNR